MSKQFTLDVQIYYEDTDFSGVVYHSNYLNYCERARDHIIGMENLVKMYSEQGYGFVVYRSELHFKEGAVFGDLIEVRSHLKKESDYRIIFFQDIYRKKDGKLLVKCINELVCIDQNKKMIALPELLRAFI